MSGGHFDYKQFHINDIAESIAEYLKDNKYGYSVTTIREFCQALYVLQAAAIYAQRIDWLLSGDDSEESFHERLKEECDNLVRQHGRYKHGK